ncbi:putative PAS/PAC sensor protein [Verrucomicrobia bacterium]|nr:putative PAS/PAC sensor protein [Verrucomicrobiota bacterium]
MEQEPLKILLIEHDASFARYVGEMLRQTRELSADMQSATDLKSGFSALGRDRFDVLLLDLCIPDGAGLANVSLIRAEAPRLPIIAAGDSDDETVALEAVQAGAQDYLVKSQLTPSWLERSIRYAMERHRVDTALLDAEQKYHTVFDHLVEGIFQTTPEGRYLMANAALARIYGYASPEDLIQNVTDIGQRLYVQPGRREEFVRLMQEQDTITRFESQIFRKDGSIIWISENCRAVRDARGQLLYYEGTVEDITQRRQAEEDLRNSEALYHSLVETIPQNIFRKDLAGRFTFGNQQFCRTLNRSLSEILGKTDADFFPPGLAAKYQQDDLRVMATGQTFATVEEHLPPGGDRMYVQVVKTPIVGTDGQVLGLQGIFWDITAERLAEENIRKANGLLAQSRQELHARNVEMEEELKMASQIQLTMLPQQYPSFPASAASGESAFQFTHRYLPTGAVGGDFFSVSALSDAEAVVFICDVAGHGVRSALITAMIRALVEELAPLASQPGQFLTKLNGDLLAILKPIGEPLFTTAFYLVANSQTRLVRYANAGHPRPIHLRRSQGCAEFLADPPGKRQPLGLFEDAVFQTSEFTLAPRDLVMLFTDGLYDVEGPDKTLGTPALVLAGVERRLRARAPQLFDELLEEIRRFSATQSFADDVCLVGMDFNPAPPPGCNT